MSHYIAALYLAPDFGHRAASTSASEPPRAGHDAEELLEIALHDSFPASDPAASNICN